MSSPEPSLTCRSIHPRLQRVVRLPPSDRLFRSWSYPLRQCIPGLGIQEVGAWQAIVVYLRLQCILQCFRWHPGIWSDTDSRSQWFLWLALVVLYRAMTIILVPAFWFVFPKSPTEAWFLTAEEKLMMQARYDSDPSWGNEDSFSWKECAEAFADPKWYMFFTYQFSVNISLYGLTTFFPAIIKGLGYTSVHANLMTVPVYVCSLVFFLIVAYFSDKTGMRGPFLAGSLLLLIIGYAILISVDNLKVRFFACFGKFSCDISVCVGSIG
jgi:hypothetical protein